MANDQAPAPELGLSEEEMQRIVTNAAGWISPEGHEDYGTCEDNMARAIRQLARERDEARAELHHQVTANGKLAAEFLAELAALRARAEQAERKGEQLCVLYGLLRIAALRYRSTGDGTEILEALAREDAAAASPTTTGDER